MSEEVQERFEDYQELERYIEQLRLQRSARLPANLAPQHKCIYSMAALFHTASRRITDPSPEFSTQLYQHLRKQMRDDNNRQGAAAGIEEAPTLALRLSAPTAFIQDQTQFRNIYRNNQASQPDQISSTHPETSDTKKRKMRGVSRRTLFRGGTIAASLLAGAGIGATIEHALEPQPTPPNPHPAIAEDTPGTWRWQPITSVERLGNGPVAFKTNTITGYVTLHTENGSGATPSLTEQVIAFSGACPHQGCIVQWQNNNQQFLCPCHGRVFDTAGGPVYAQDSQPNLTALPRLEIKVDKNGNIYVKVP